MKKIVLRGKLTGKENEGIISIQQEVVDKLISKKFIEENISNNDIEAYAIAYSNEVGPVVSEVDSKNVLINGINNLVMGMVEYVGEYIHNHRTVEKPLYVVFPGDLILSIEYRKNFMLSGNLGNEFLKSVGAKEIEAVDTKDGEVVNMLSTELVPDICTFIEESKSIACSYQEDGVEFIHGVYYTMKEVIVETAKKLLEEGEDLVVIELPGWFEIHLENKDNEINGQFIAGEDLKKKVKDDNMQG